MRKIIILGLAVGLLFTAGTEMSSGAQDQQPKLLVLIVIDQMQQNYLNRFADQFGPDGFKRLLRQGANLANTHYGQASTVTAVGHAVISTGTWPYRSGIVGNSWYDRATKQWIYVAQDKRYKLVGPDSTRSRGTAPTRLRVTTLGDELNLQSNGRAKVFGVSIKDRSAILLAGHRGMAYWFNQIEGIFCTSTYYRTALPDWVVKFNAENRPDEYYGRIWERAKPAKFYRRARTVGNGNERNYKELQEDFPHPLTGGEAKPGKAFYQAFTCTPWSNDYLFAFARRLVMEEKMGIDGVADLLALSLSASDIVGHTFGPYSDEVMDMFIRTDEQLADFLRFLDHQIGLEHILIVLTADHGVAPIPKYLQNQGIDAGYVYRDTVKQRIEDTLDRVYGTEDWVEMVAWTGIYLNQQALIRRKVDPQQTETLMAQVLYDIPGVAEVYGRSQLLNGPLSPDRYGRSVSRAFDRERSGDVLFVPKPYYYMAGKRTPHSNRAHHGTPYSYDTHVPLILSGPGIIPGTYYEPTCPVDLAPTLAAYLGITLAQTDGHVLYHILRQQSEHR